MCVFAFVVFGCDSYASVGSVCLSDRTRNEKTRKMSLGMSKFTN